MKRIVIALGSFGLVALLGFTMVNGVVNAQTTTSGGTATTESTSKKDQFLSTLAGKLGVSTTTLQSAIEQTTSELGFGPGRFGGRLRERIQDRIEKHRERVIDRMDLAQVALFIGITQDELKAEQRDGLTFIEIAREHGKSDDQIRAFLIERVTEKIDARLAATSESDATPAGA